VGIVPQFEAKKIHRIWRPILNELESKTGLRFTLRGSPTIPKFEKEFNAGNFDFAYMNPYHVLLANKREGYVPLTRDIGRTLHGILVVRKDSPYTSPKDLAGQRIAFPAPNALGASLIMRADFLDIFHTRIKPDYVKTHSSVYLNVALGQAEAGGAVQKTLSQQPQYIQDELKVLYRTRETAPHPFSAHPRVSKEVQAKVLNALLEMGKTEKGRKLLKKIPVKKIGKAQMADYEPIHEMNLDRLYVGD
jgi:phosphonate transport system substrate-binding protein